MICPHCHRKMELREASIPERIICYKAGTQDPNNPENRIVQESVCPKHGTIYSPGGGVCATFTFLGGPKDGEQIAASPFPFVFEDETGIEHLYEPRLEDWFMVYKGVVGL